LPPPSPPSNVMNRPVSTAWCCIVTVY